MPTRADEVGTQRRGSRTEQLWERGGAACRGEQTATQKARGQHWLDEFGGLRLCMQFRNQQVQRSSWAGTWRGQGMVHDGGTSPGARSLRGGGSSLRARAPPSFAETDGSSSLWRVVSVEGGGVQAGVGRRAPPLGMQDMPVIERPVPPQRSISAPPTLDDIDSLFSNMSYSRFMSDTVPEEPESQRPATAQRDAGWTLSQLEASPSPPPIAAQRISGARAAGFIRRPRAPSAKRRRYPPQPQQLLQQAGRNAPTAALRARARARRSRTRSRSRRQPCYPSSSCSSPVCVRLPAPTAATAASNSCSSWATTALTRVARPGATVHRRRLAEHGAGATQLAARPRRRRPARPARIRRCW